MNGRINIIQGSKNNQSFDAIGMAVRKPINSRLYTQTVIDSKALPNGRAVNGRIQTKIRRISLD